MPRLHIQELKKVKLLEIGNPGVGKTHLIGTAADDPRSAPVLLCDFSGNPQTVASKVGAGLIPWKIDKISELETLMGWLRSGQPDSPLREEIGLPKGVNIQTLAIDTLTEFQRVQAIEVMGPAYATLTADKKIEWPEWQKILTRGVNLARYVNDPTWPTHVILTVHLKSGEDGMGQLQEPLLWGQSVREVPGYLPAVGWLTKVESLPATLKKKFSMPEGTARAMIFFEVLRVMTLKEQYEGRIPPVVWDPTFTKLLDAVGA